MTDLRAAAQLALEALEALYGGCTDSDDGTVEEITVWCPEIIEDLKAALAEPVQEPVGVVTSMVKGGVTWHRWPDEMPDGTHLYTSLPQRPAEPTQRPVAWRYSTMGKWVYVDINPNLWHDKPDGEVQALYVKQSTVCCGEEKNGAMLTDSADVASK